MKQQKEVRQSQMAIWCFMPRRVMLPIQFSSWGCPPFPQESEEAPIREPLKGGRRYPKNKSEKPSTGDKSHPKRNALLSPVILRGLLSLIFVWVYESKTDEAVGIAGEPQREPPEEIPQEKVIQRTPSPGKIPPEKPPFKLHNGEKTWPGRGFSVCGENFQRKRPG